MIIRSQDRKIITSDLNLEICQNDYIHTYEISCGSFTLGEYTTEEKAIRVLNMIQNAYERYKLFSITYSDGLLQKMEQQYGFDYSRELISIVFQMPKDEEVVL